MNTMRSFFLVAVIAVMLLCASALGGDAQHWSGVVRLPGRVELGLVLHLEQDDGGWGGTFDIPEQGMTGVCVIDLVFDDETLSFVLPIPNQPELLHPKFDLKRDGNAAEGTMTQGGVPFPVKLAIKTDDEIAAEAAARRPQTPRPPFPYSQEQVTVPVGANGDPLGDAMHTLGGTLTLPEAAVFGEGPHPCVVMVTGSGPQDRDETIFDHRPFALIADRLTRQGVGVLRCDDRGVGASGGDFAVATTQDFADDVRAQIAYLRTRGDIDADRIGIIGHSEGGVIAPMVAGEDERVAFVVLMAGPGVTGRRVLIGQGKALLKAGGARDDQLEKITGLHKKVLDLIVSHESRDELFEAMKTLIVAQQEVATGFPASGEALENAARMHLDGSDTPWMRSFIALDPAVYLRKVTQPVLVLAGGKDLQVLPDENIPPIKAALKENGNKEVTVKFFPQCNHLFQPAHNGGIAEYAMIGITIDEEVLDALSGWVKEQAGVE